MEDQTFDPITIAYLAIGAKNRLSRMKDSERDELIEKYCGEELLISHAISFYPFLERFWTCYSNQLEGISFTYEVSEPFGAACIHPGNEGLSKEQIMKQVLQSSGLSKKIIEEIYPSDKAKANGETIAFIGIGLSDKLRSLSNTVTSYHFALIRYAEITKNIEDYANFLDNFCVMKRPYLWELEFQHEIAIPFGEKCLVSSEIATKESIIKSVLEESQLSPEDLHEIFGSD